MKLDFQLLYVMMGIGLVYKRLSWRGWLGVTTVVFLWLMWNWKR